MKVRKKKKKQEVFSKFFHAEKIISIDIHQLIYECVRKPKCGCDHTQWLMCFSDVEAIPVRGTFGKFLETIPRVGLRPVREFGSSMVVLARYHKSS